MVIKIQDTAKQEIIGISVLNLICPELQTQGLAVLNTLPHKLYFSSHKIISHRVNKEK